MKRSVYILILNLIICCISYSQARRIVIEMNHAKYDAGLSNKNIIDIENNLTQLVKQYIEWGSFQNDEGTYSEINVNKFVDLFSTDAVIYSDLHIDYQEMLPKEYAAQVKDHFGDYGVDATIDYAGLISLFKTSNEDNYQAHLTIQKINYSKISKTNKRQFFKNGQIVKFDMFISVDMKNHIYKINKITNETEKSEDIASIEKQKIIPPAVLASATLPIRKKYNRKKAKHKPTSFMRLSVRSQLAQENTSTGLSSKITSPLTIEALIYKKSIFDTYLSMGLQVSKRSLSSTMENNQEYIDHGSIPYISTSWNYLLEINEETNTQMINTSDMAIYEEINYSQYAFLLGLQKQIIFEKFNAYIGVDVMPGFQIFQTGNRQLSGLSGQQIPDNEYFPDIDLINTIDPDALNASEYQINETEDISLRATNRFLVDAGFHVMLEYSIHEKISLSTKIGKQLNVWKQSYTGYNPQLNPLSLNTDHPIKLNPIHFDFGIILKY